VRKLIAGPSVFVCDECVELCNDIIREELEDAPNARATSSPSPTKSRRSRRIRHRPGARQEGAPVAVYNHYKRLQTRTGSRSKDEVEIAKSNILLIGPTAAARRCSRRRWRGC